MIAVARPRPHVSVPAPEPVIIPATDGYPLGATRFRTGPGGHGRLVIVAGATGVRQRFYRGFAAHLAEAGFEVVTFDYRGIGGSRPASLRGFDATMRDWGSKDLEGVLRHARHALGHASVDLVGHSVGGQLLGLVENARLVRRLVGVAAQLGDLRLWPVRDRLRLGLLLHGAVPALVGTLGYLPSWLGFGEDLPGGVAREWARWCTTPGFFVPYLSTVELDRFTRFPGPVLAYSIERDPFATRAAVDAWQDLFASAAIRREHLDAPGLGHFGFFKPDAAARWGAVIEFLRPRM